MQIRLAADLQTDSIVDGVGIRTVIWTQGCSHNCPGCHNKETQDFNAGALVDIEYIKEEMSELSAQDGVTFSGGDPFYQPEQCAILADYAKQLGLNVWCYTGFTYEQLMILSKKNKSILDFLNKIDVLVDGPFLIDKHSYEAKFRGSTNQRVIDVQKTLNSNEIVLVELGETKTNINFGRYNYNLYV